jgi:hypothetical protein
LALLSSAKFFILFLEGNRDLETDELEELEEEELEEDELDSLVT